MIAWNSHIQTGQDVSLKEPKLIWIINRKWYGSYVLVVYFMHNRVYKIHHWSLKPCASRRWIFTKHIVQKHTRVYSLPPFVVSAFHTVNIKYRLHQHECVNCCITLVKLSAVISIICLNFASIKYWVRIVLAVSFTKSIDLDIHFFLRLQYFISRHLRFNH